MSKDHTPVPQEILDEINELIEHLSEYQRYYYVDAKPRISDADYDALSNRLEDLERRYPQAVRPDSPTQRVGSDLSADFPEVEHSIPVLSLDKAYSLDELERWLTKMTGQGAGRYVVEEKLDGASLVLYYKDGILDRAVTRGNGRVGNDITANVRTISQVPLRLPLALTGPVRGEVYLSKSDFEVINRTMETPYANPRNLAAGSLRRIKSREVASIPLRIFVYEAFFEDDGLSAAWELLGRSEAASISLQDQHHGRSHWMNLILLERLGFPVNRRTALLSAMNPGPHPVGLSPQEAEYPEEAGASAETSSSQQPAPPRDQTGGHPGGYEGGGNDSTPGTPRENKAGQHTLIRQLEHYLQTETRERSSLDYEIDGLVLKVDDLQLRETLGYTGHHPRWAMAYKFESPQGISRVISIDVQIGRTGRVTPVARIEAVEIGGSTIQNVTLHNQDYINALELAPGDLVRVSRRGDVIPAIEAVEEKGESQHPVWQIPQACPTCSTPLVKNGAHHFCPNFDCPDRQLGRLVFFLGRDQMDIENLGAETAELLWRRGLIHDIPDIYQIPYETLLDLPGFGEKKIQLIRQGVERSLGQPYRLVLPSLGLPDVGPKVTELLITQGYRSIDDLFSLIDRGDSNALLEIKGLGERTVERLTQALSEPRLRNLVARLREAGLQFSQSPEDGLDSRDSRLPQIFDGQSWCVTGSFEQFKPRDLAMTEVKKRGGTVVSDVSGKTTHLLAGEKAGSKLKKAQNLGVQVVTEKEFLDLLEYPRE
ncbi:NAD-dependent DNA ligase LigA [Spirochaeta lutea]|uniref:NAD-dependent DNA ligase LigA n=1 Tax=Spirochaeta lutea TaxID=1480694 RepID=UPI00055A1AA1|nr:NAD-dependent DNA ligase LigA [Spirochaeta lutea]